jgi:5-formyltetrahydrofolate cyclo-ligase
VGSEVAEEKRRLRREIGARRREVAPDEAEAAGRAAAERLLSEPRLAGSSRVALYAALPDELPTRPLFEALAARGVPRLAPRTLAEGRLAFAPVERWEDLVVGRFGVLEPPAGAAAARLDPGDLVVVPGLAFDAAGHRLGWGAGYYDRAFPTASGEPGRAGPRLVGFAYELQLVDRVPHDSRDRGMDAIVSERRTLWVATDWAARDRAATDRAATDRAKKGDA